VNTILLSKSNGLVDNVYPTINIIACSMTMIGSNIPRLWVKAVKLATYLMTGLSHQSLVSSKTLWERFHSKRWPLVYLKLFGHVSLVHIYIEECSYKNKYHSDAREEEIITNTSSPNMYRVLTLEAGYIFRTQDLTLSKKDYFSYINKFLQHVLGFRTILRINCWRLRTIGPINNYIWEYRNSW
jgi:hypothetical protein